MHSKSQTVNIILVVVAFLGALVVYGAQRAGIHVSPPLVAAFYALAVAGAGFCESYVAKSPGTPSVPLDAVRRLTTLLSLAEPLLHEAAGLLPVAVPAFLKAEPLLQEIVADKSPVLASKLAAFTTTLQMNQTQLLAEIQALKTASGATLPAAPELPITDGVLLLPPGTAAQSVRLGGGGLVS